MQDHAIAWKCGYVNWLCAVQLRRVVVKNTTDVSREAFMHASSQADTSAVSMQHWSGPGRQLKSNLQWLSLTELSENKFATLHNWIFCYFILSRLDKRQYSDDCIQCVFGDV